MNQKLNAVVQTSILADKKPEPNIGCDINVCYLFRLFVRLTIKAIIVVRFHRWPFPFFSLSLVCVICKIELNTLMNVLFAMILNFCMENGHMSNAHWMWMWPMAVTTSVAYALHILSDEIKITVHFIHMHIYKKVYLPFYVFYER